MSWDREKNKKNTRNRKCFYKFYVYKHERKQMRHYDCFNLTAWYDTDLAFVLKIPMFWDILNSEVKRKWKLNWNKKCMDRWMEKTVRTTTFLHIKCIFTFIKIVSIHFSVIFTLFKFEYMTFIQLSFEELWIVRYEVKDKCIWK